MKGFEKLILSQLREEVSTHTDVKLLQMDVNPHWILWVLSFLTDR